MFILIIPPFYVCTHTRNLNHVLVLILLLLILILPPTNCIFFDAARSYFCSQLAERMLHCFRPSCDSCNSWSSGAFGGLRPLRTWRLPGLWEIWLLPLFAFPCLISSPFICRRPDWEKEEQTRFVLGEFPEHVRIGIEKEWKQRGIDLECLLRLATIVPISYISPIITTTIAIITMIITIY